MHSSIAAGLAATAVAVVLAAPLGAQAPGKGTTVRILGGTSLRSGAGGDRVAVTTGELQAVVDLTAPSFVRVTLEGYVRARDVQLLRQRQRGDVKPANGTPLRPQAASTAAPIVSLRQGTTLYPERVGGRFPSGNSVSWLKVRRAFWVDVSRLKSSAGATVAAADASPPPSVEKSAAAPANRATPAADKPAEPAAGTAVVSDSADGRLAADAVSPVEGAVVTARGAVGADLSGLAATGAPLRVNGGGGAALRAGPDGDVIATISGDAPLSTLGRKDGWVRVRLDGWMPDTAVAVPGLSDRATLTAAELKASPVAHVGRLVRWTVEVLAFQTADALREGLSVGEPYLLARGPEAERAVLYLAVPPALVAEARALPALARIVVTARIRDGRSRPSGVPILEVLELVRP